MTRRRRFAIFYATLVVLLIMVAAAGVCARDPNGYRSIARRSWNKESLDYIVSRLDEPGWADRESRRLSAAAGDRYGARVAPEVLVARDGGWIEYRAVCHKSNPAIADLFVGRGSDGRWYYSNYHFCSEMCAILEDAQPQSLAQLVRRYSLRPFDGQSDDCLNPTWDGKPGEDPPASQP